MIKKLEQIKEAIDKYYQIDISCNSRTLNYVKARANYYFIVRKLLPQATSLMTGMVVNRDHATVLHGRKTHESLFISDNEYAETSMHLLNSLEHIKANESYLLSNNFKDIVKINLELKEKINRLEKELQNYKIIKPIAKVVENKPDHFAEIYECGEDILNEFIENRYKPFIRMNKLKVAN